LKAHRSEKSSPSGFSTEDSHGRAGALIRYRPVIVLALCYLLFGAVLRVVLWANFGSSQGIPLSRLPLLLAGGSVNDVVQSLYLFAPLALYLFLIGDTWYRSRSNRALLTAATFLTLFGLLFVCIAEYYFFEEFDARFNVVAVDYLIFPAEVIGDLWTEYPIVKLSAGAALLAGLLTPLLMRAMQPSLNTNSRLSSRMVPFAAYGVLLGTAIAWYPTSALSWSANRIENELVQNGDSSFFRALTKSEIDYHAYYPTEDSARNLQMLGTRLSADGGKPVDLDQGRLDRDYPARPAGLGRLNVVVIASESFGAEFSRLYGSERDLTPNFDRLAQQGAWFSHAYATGTRTVRGLEAITASFPPIPTVSILRRPGSENISNWGSVMRDLGYSTSFLYGGYGHFDNMNHFFGSNGFQVLDRQNLSSPPRFENIWGVSDEDLFDMALEHFDRRSISGSPFFAIVMTTSNHKPYTFREGVPGVPAEGGGRKAGVRYADFALGYFMEQAAHHDWFDDTLFVVVADHGARVYGKADIPLRSYEIPLMLYSPKHVEPKRIDTLTSQIDIAPTVLGLLGLSYRAPFFGQDVLNTPEQDRIALFSHNHDIAIYRDGRLSLFALQSKPVTFLYDRNANSYTRTGHDTELENLGIAYFQSAYELFQRRAY